MHMAPAGRFIRIEAVVSRQAISFRRTQEIALGYSQKHIGRPGRRVSLSGKPPG
jgi:hypothetical protein